MCSEDHQERVCSRNRPEIGIEQCGFVTDTGTRNAMFMVRMISERAIEKQRDFYMCFIDYTKAFDRVQHDEQLKMMMNLDLYRKDICLIWNLYWDQSTCIWIENKIKGIYQNQKRSMSRMCFATWSLQSLQWDYTMRNRRSERFDQWRRKY